MRVVVCIIPRGISAHGMPSGPLKGLGDLWAGATNELKQLVVAGRGQTRFWGIGQHREASQQALYPYRQGLPILEPLAPVESPEASPERSELRLWAGGRSWATQLGGSGQHFSLSSAKLCLNVMGAHLIKWYIG